MERIRVCAILRHQQPARKPCLDHMEARTARGLRKLAQMDVDVAVDPVLQRRAAPQFAAEGQCAHPQRRSRALHNRLHRGRVYTEDERDPEDAFVSDQADFKGRSIVDRHDQRNEAAYGKIDVAKALGRRVKRLCKRQLHCFALGQQPATIAAWQRLEQAIDRGRTLD